jgi:glycosyltransferase involved in cell wall biosynthesis
MSSSHPLNVLLMAQQLGPGGTERQVTEIARALDRTRFRPHVACLVDGPRGRELREAGVPVLDLALRSFQSPAALRGAVRLVRYIRANRIRLAHAFDYPMACFGVPLAKLAGVPVVLSSQRADRKLNPRLYLRWQRVTDRMVDGIVVNCDAMRRHLVADEGIPGQSIHLCYNGIDTARFSPNVRRKAPEEPLVVGIVALLRPEKGLDTLLEAFARVKDLRPGLRLQLVGDGEMRPRLEQLAAALGIAEQCRIDPATDDVPAWLHKIDIFVLPSLSEAFSNSLMEAMACGCAVAASNVGGNPEMVVDGETGLLFEKGDAEGLACKLRLLIEDDALRRRLAGAAVRSIRDRFSLEASARRMAEIYTSFLDRRS